MGAPYFKAVDIPDEAFVDAIRTAMTITGSPVWASRWDVGCILDGRADLLVAAEKDPSQWFADYPNATPQKVIIAKARKLIKRRLIDGCDCGCRGDFEIRT